jgi:hypothetical protein
MTTDIEKHVIAYLTDHPEYQYPASGDRHPSILAAGPQMKPWIMERLGGPLPFWKAMLESAKVWFGPGCDSREFRLFCSFLEAEGNVWWNGLPEFEALSAEYNGWRRGVRGQGQAPNK